MFKERPHILRSLMDNCSKYDDARWLLDTMHRGLIRDHVEYLESAVLTLTTILIAESVIICACVIRSLFF